MHLEQAGASVHRCGTIARATLVFCKEVVHGVVCDCRLPDGDGFAWLGRVAGRASALPRARVGVSGFAIDPRTQLALQAANVIVLTKPVDAPMLIAALQVACMRAGIGVGKIIRFGGSIYDGASATLFGEGSAVKLNDKELAILACLLRADRPLHAREIAELAFDEKKDPESAAHLVRHYIGTLRAAFAEAGLRMCIEHVQGRGYWIVR